MTRIFIDMDGVLADFMGAVKSHPDYGKVELDKLPVFEDLEPIEGAIESVSKLWNSDEYDVYILSTAPWDNPEAWTHKRLWIEKHLPFMNRRLILSHHKHLCCQSEDDIIIDDRTKNGVQKWPGHHIHFGQKPFQNWNEIMQYLEI